jgi:hypothetical protein
LYLFFFGMDDLEIDVGAENGLSAPGDLKG